MRSSRMAKLGVWIALLAILLLSAVARAEEPKLADLVRDLQQQELGKQKILLVWWIPVDYWKAAFQGQPGLTEEAKQQIYNALDNYFLVCVADGKITAFGDIQARLRDEIIKNVTLRLANGTQLTPLADDDVSDEAKSVVAVMKPAVANAAGKLGKSMEFIFFDGKDQQGNRIADPKADGGFTINVGAVAMRWRLPLGSMLPPKYDLKTGEKFPGNYQFNPFTGQKLTGDAPKEAPVER